jgi:hypothetical protein
MRYGVRLVAPIAWMAVIWMLSSLPAAADQTIGGIFMPKLLQKTAHLVVYGVLGGAWFWVFDFGRSKKGTGAYEYKCHWGFEPEPLRYRVYVQNGGPVPDHSASDSNVQILRRVWKKLPLPVTKLVGPFLLRRYGAYYT